MIARAACEQAFWDAVRACDPERLVERAMPNDDRSVIAIAIGKAALAMARGAGDVARGIAIAPVLDGQPLPLGWTALDSAHPVPDERSLVAADAAIEVIEDAEPTDLVVALISGGASALIERPAPGVTLAALRGEIATLMASGASIHELNARRKQLSAIKGGKLAQLSPAPIVTLVASDVIGDDPAVVGSGPTVSDRAGDRVEVIAPMHAFADAFATRLGYPRASEPFIGDVAATARALAELPGRTGWGEALVRIPDDHGEGGRAQQLALELAKLLRGTARSAFVAGSDGIDGPAPRDRPAPAGAYVDGGTWDAIRAAGIDPERALARCDAGTALHAIGALFITGPTGINHADIALVG